MSPGNPYERVKAAPEPTPQETAPQPTQMFGPGGPQVGIPTPTERLGRVAIPAHAVNTVWWVGVHGGSGESTLTKLLPGSMAADHRWPIPPPPNPSKVVLVARTHFSGLSAAQRAATEWASGAVPGVNVLGLVLIADAPGRLPRSLEDFGRVVGGGVPRVWNIPWIEEWRKGEEVSPENTPDKVFGVLEEIYRLGS